MHNNELREEISDWNEEALLVDGFDEAIIGMVEMFGKSPVVCYDREKIIDIIEADCDGDRGDAEEYFDFNILGAYCGESMPVFLTKLREVKDA